MVQNEITFIRISDEFKVFVFHPQISQFRVFKSVTPFDRRVTALAWHPKEPTLCAVGSKGGDLLLWNYVKDEFQSLLVIINTVQH